MNKKREVPVRIIVRTRHHGGHTGGAWKVAFADFMTAMFALFLVLWLVNQSSDVKSAIAGYFQDPLGRANEFGSSILPGEGAQAATVRLLAPPDVLDLRRDRLQQMAATLKHKISEIPALKALGDHIEIEITDEGLRIQLIEDASGVFFETGSASLSGRGRQILALLGAELGKLSNRVRIDGHTDARPYVGSSSYTNWELSADRANSARRILLATGLREDQLDQIRGFAARDPHDRANPLSPRNRRIAITVLLHPDTPRLDLAAPPDSAGADSGSVKTPGHSTVTAAGEPTIGETR